MTGISMRYLNKNMENCLVTSDMKIVRLTDYQVPFYPRHSHAVGVPFVKKTVKSLCGLYDCTGIPDEVFTEKEFDDLLKLACYIDEERDGIATEAQVRTHLKGMFHCLRHLRQGNLKVLAMYNYPTVSDHLCDRAMPSFMDRDCLVAQESVRHLWIVKNFLKAPRKFLFLSSAFVPHLQELNLANVKTVAIQSSEPLSVDHDGYVHVPM